MADAEELFDEVPDAIASDPPPPEPKYVKTLEQWKSRFKEFQSITQDNRKKQEVHYKYYDKDGQLTREERNELEERGQPDTIINRFRVAINGIIGVVANSHTAPLGLPREPKDDAASGVATECLRYVTHQNRFKHEKKYLLKDNLLGGVCAVLVGLGEEKGDIPLIPIRWEEFFYDPRSKRVDFADARYMGIAKWMYTDEVKELGVSEAVSVQLDTLFDAGGLSGRTGNGTDDTFDDRPIDQGWYDPEFKRVQVVEIFEKVKGKWMRCLFWEGGIIEEEVSPYLDDKGKPCNPIVAESCYVDIDNNRVGYATDLIDLQDEINKRRQKALWEISSNQIEAADPSAIEVSADEARKEAARPDGVIPYGWKKVAGSDRSAGNMALLNEAKGEMERFSPNPAMLGRQGADTSGRAMLARQQAGLIELALVLEQFEDLELRVYQQIWCRIKQDWDVPMFIRVTNDADAVEFLGLNQPKQPPEVPQLDEAGQPVLDEATGQPVMVQQATGEEFGFDNHVAEMGIDVMIDSAPETATIMAEQITELRAMVSSNPNYAQEVPFEIFLEMTNMPRKRELIKKIRAAKEAAQKAAQEQQQQTMQMQMAELEAKIKQMLADAGLKEAQGQAALAGAEQGHIRTAVQADKTLAGIDAEATRVQMEGARTTNEILSTPQPDAGGSGETEEPAE